MENATGNIVIPRVEDLIAGGGGLTANEITIDGTHSNLPFEDPNLPPPRNTPENNESFATSDFSDYTYFIEGFSSAGILVDVGSDFGPTPSDPTRDIFFIISSTNLGDSPGTLLTFTRNGEFDGVLGSGGGPPPPPPPKTAGQAAIWHLNGTTIDGGGSVNPNPGLSWQAIGTGDFNHDGRSDILWQNTSTGQASIWEMIGNTLSGGGPVTPNPGPAWKAMGTGDFNDDSRSDILWQNTITGQASIWEMNGNTLVGGGPISPSPGMAWKAIGTGDFNHDNHSDILWQNTTTGQVSIWEMNGNNVIGAAPVASPGTSWHAVGVGDFFGDGNSDILLQNAISGQVAIWRMNGTNAIGGGILGPNPGPSWHAIGAGDYFNPGIPGFSSDILFQNTSSGQISIWRMDDLTIVGGGTVGSNPGTSWHAIGADASGETLFQNRGS
jgi:hypothetical protein